MKILFAITVSFFLLTSTETEYKKITDKTEIQSLAKKYDQTYYNLTCENSHLKLLKKEGAAILECAEEKGVLSIEKEGEETNSSHQNTLLLKILETEYKNGVDIEKLEVYSDEESMLICITLLDDSVVAFLKE